MCKSSDSWSLESLRQALLDGMKTGDLDPLTLKGFSWSLGWCFTYNHVVSNKAFNYRVFGVVLLQVNTLVPLLYPPFQES